MRLRVWRRPSGGGPPCPYSVSQLRMRALRPAPTVASHFAMTPQSLFITGTDTGVGKTMVTVLLALHFQGRGADVGVMKPIATGCMREAGELVSEDATWLKAVTGVADSLDLI